MTDAELTEIRERLERVRGNRGRRQTARSMGGMAPFPDMRDLDIEHALAASDVLLVEVGYRHNKRRALFDQAFVDRRNDSRPHHVMQPQDTLAFDVSQSRRVPYDDGNFTIARRTNLLADTRLVPPGLKTVSHPNN